MLFFLEAMISGILTSGIEKNIVFGFAIGERVKLGHQQQTLVIAKDTPCDGRFSVNTEANC